MDVVEEVAGVVGVGIVVLNASVLGHEVLQDTENYLAQAHAAIPRSGKLALLASNTDSKRGAEHVRVRPTRHMGHLRLCPPLPPQLTTTIPPHG